MRVSEVPLGARRKDWAGLESARCLGCTNSVKFLAWEADFSLRKGPAKGRVLSIYRHCSSLEACLVSCQGYIPHL